MDKQVQIRKGTTAANDAFTGALGELSCDTQQNRLRVHDGATPGGFPIAGTSLINTFSQSQVIDPPVNSQALLLTGLSLTGSDANSFLSMFGNWNTTGSPAAFHIEISNSASGATSKVAWFKISNLFAASVKPGLQLENPSGAFSGLQQYSPSLNLVGQGWKTTAVAASQPVEFRVYVQPVQGTTNPTANLLIDFAVDGGAFANRFKLSSEGVLTANGLSIVSGTNQRAGNAVLVAGTVTVANTTVTVNTIVMLTRKTSGGTPGTLITYTVSAGASFTINSDSALDTSTFSYFLIEVP